MEDYLLVNVGGLNIYQLGDIFEDAEAKGYIFPEESGVKVESHLLSIGSLDWKHGERHATVTNVSVENSLKGRCVTDLSLIHAANTLLHGHHLAEIEVRIAL